MPLPKCVIALNLLIIASVWITASSARPIAILLDRDCKCLMKVETFLEDFKEIFQWTYQGQRPNEEMIRKLQEHLNLNVTGELDNPTCDLMNRRWEQKFITWRLKNGTSSSKNLGMEEVEGVLNDAFEIWSGTVDLKFFHVDKDDDNADISIFFKEQRNCSGKPLNHSINDVLIDEHFACIEQNTRMVGHVLNVHIHDTYYWYVDRNADLSSTEGNRDYIKLLPGALHVIGHALGLDNLKNGSGKGIMSEAPDFMYHFEHITENDKQLIKKFYKLRP